MEVQTTYQQTILFATTKHLEKHQTLPGTNLPYVVHLSNVAMEILMAAPNSDHFNLSFAIQVALLHDTLEDTNTSFEELENKFGTAVANAVQALTKNDTLPKASKMTDSLQRIKSQPKEVWAVKLADRITNLQKPPVTWDALKIANYKKEAELILKTLAGGNPYLEKRLQQQISCYPH
jgi:guanosine-3',5'-bis(diphosphate) 3'-pyrophosphohydrolase